MTFMIILINILFVKTTNSNGKHNDYDRQVVSYIFTERCVIIQNKVESKAKLAAAAKQQFYGIVVNQCNWIYLCMLRHSCHNAVTTNIEIHGGLNIVNPSLG